MYNLVNSNFNRTYNPSGSQNALCDIKRLLTSRDTEAQNKACGYLIEVISRYSKNSNEGALLVESLLNNDITVFLCEAISNLDFSLFRSVLTCLRLLWREGRFFAEEHAAHALAAVLRALAHYAESGAHAAVDASLHFLCDLLNGISTHGTTAPLSHQSAYSAEQLLACLNALAPLVNTNPSTILSSALVLHGLVSYQPDNLVIKGCTATALVEVLKKWLVLLAGAMNHSMLIGNGESGMYLVVACQLGVDVLRLLALLRDGKQKADFIQTILADDQEIGILKQCAFEMENSIQRIMSEVIVFTKENQNQISTEEYGVFLKFLLKFLIETEKSEVLVEFCDVLFSNGYLMMLPQVQIVRNDVTVRKVSTLVLGEMLKVLADKYLNVPGARADGTETNDATCAKDIHMGLVELQRGIEKPQIMGIQLQNNKPYSLLIYIYFHCQSSENPEEATAPLLPHLVDHILRLPKPSMPPPYIIKALWLVFAMATISNDTLKSLHERVYLEKATDRLVAMLCPEPAVYYTHNPAILLWAFTSLRIPYRVKLDVLSQWLKTEDTLPDDLTTEPMVWELLLNILVQCKTERILSNCIEALHVCLEAGDDEEKQEFASLIWSSLPGVLTKALIDYDCEIDRNICYFLDIATTLLPPAVDHSVCLKIAVLITTIFSKNSHSTEAMESRHHYEYVSLKLSLYLLVLSNNQNDNQVLLAYVNRDGFLVNVLTASNSLDDRVACAALQLLARVVHYFTANKYEPKSILQIQTHLIVKSLRRDRSSERGASLLQLVYTVLNSERNTPLALSYDVGVQPTAMQQCNTLRALLFRIQLMLCCRDSESESLAGWKTLSSIFKHAIVSNDDPSLIVTLTSQPWTHTLIQFQLTQNITNEFLTFTHTWLSFLKITIQKNQEQKRSQLSRLSLITKTLILMRKHLVVEEDDSKEVKEKILVIVRDIFDLSRLKLT